MKKQTLVLLTVGTLGLILLAGVSYFLFKTFISPQEDVTLAKNYILGTETSAIQSNGILVVNRDKQFVSLELESGFIPELGQGIRAPTGEVIHPELTLMDENGTSYPLRFSTWDEPTLVGRMFGGRTAGFNRPSGADPWPRGKVFVRLELKSDIPLKVKAIYWSGYNWDNQP